MPRGRPLKPDIREKIGLILSQTHFAYGYEIYKIYKNVFGEIGLRNLYYNLKKGLETGEFILANVEREPGSYTWGSEVQHLYYGGGPFMLIYKPPEKIKLKIDQLPVKERVIDWKTEIEVLTSKIKKDLETFRSIESRVKYEDKRKFQNNVKLRCIKLKEWSKLKLEKEVLKEVYGKLDEISNSIT